MILNCIIICLVILLIFWVVLKVVVYLFPECEYWDWDNGQENRLKIDLDAIHFPKNFLWGSATAAHQVEGGHTNNNWYRFENKTLPNGKTPIKNNHKSGKTCDHWNLYKEDIKLMKDLHLNAYRFSLSWSKIQPEKGIFDEGVLRHYSEVINELLDKDIVPMVTLHHFEQPIWFEDEGSWEKEENIQYFLDFSMRVFKEYAPRVKFWCTINEPEVFVTGGWVNGDFPPGKKASPLSTEVLKNILEAHVRCYTALKSTDLGDQVQIGFVKDIFFFEPYNPLNPLDQFLARTIDQSFNECILEFFRSGIFDTKVPGSSRVRHINPKAKTSNDFVGLNYYSHFHMKFELKNPPWSLVHRPLEIMTDMNYPIYAEGFYRALKRMSTLKVPIYVTENGIADGDDTRRPLSIRRNLYALSRAMSEGIDVRGYFYWSLMDNFEWAEGYHPKFGLYHVDFETQQRTLRNGARYLTDVIKRFS